MLVGEGACQCHLYQGHVAVADQSLRSSHKGCLHKFEARALFAVRPELRISKQNTKSSSTQAPPRRATNTPIGRITL